MNPPRGAKKYLIGRDLHGGLSLPEGASFFRGRPVLRVDTLFAKIALVGIAPQELAGTDCSADPIGAVCSIQSPSSRIG